MTKNRKNRGREYGKNLKARKVKDAIQRILKSRGSSDDLNIAIDKWSNKTM